MMAPPEPALALRDPHDPLVELGNELRLRRQAKQLSLRDMADEVGIHWNTLRAMEKARPVAAINLITYGGYLGLEPNDVASRLGWWKAPGQRLGEILNDDRLARSLVGLVGLEPDVKDSIIVVFSQMVEAAVQTKRGRDALS